MPRFVSALAWSAVGLFLVGCVVTPGPAAAPGGPAGPHPGEHRQRQQQPPPPPEQPETGPDSGRDEIDCAERPRTMCCKALTPECQDCARRADEKLAQWEQECQAPPAVDCSQPPTGGCCKALTPACRECARNLTEKRAAWEKTCGPQDG